MSNSPKKVKFGTVISKLDKNGNKSTFVALGQKGKDPKWNTTVEITVKDANGKVISHQVDGFMQVNNPHKVSEQLLASLSEEQQQKALERAAKVPENILSELFVNSTV